MVPQARHPGHRDEPALAGRDGNGCRSPYARRAEPSL